MTEWPQILTLYDQLAAFDDSPVVALNRAVALAEVNGVDAALASIGELPLDSYYLLHAVRADFLRRLGRRAEAVGEYDTALGLTDNEAELAFLRRARRVAAGG
jgi:RNA polymerase sigma-70 factor (ECF subfamily)